MEFTIRHGAVIIQQDDQHERCSQRDVEGWWSAHNYKEQTGMTRSTSGVEGDGQVAWVEDEPGDDRSDVGWTAERGVEHQVRVEGDDSKG